MAQVLSLLAQKTPFYIFNFFFKQVNLEKLGLIVVNFQLSRSISFRDTEYQTSHNLFRFTPRSHISNTILREQVRLKS